jgi:hypothetical protein
MLQDNPVSFFDFIWYGRQTVPMKNCLYKEYFDNYRAMSFSFYLSIWVKPQPQKRLATFEEILTKLTSGEAVRWVVNLKGCKCPPDPTYCGHGLAGDTIKGLLFGWSLCNDFSSK